MMYIRLLTQLTQIKMCQQTCTNNQTHGNTPPSFDSCWRQLWQPVALVNPMGHLLDLWRLDAAHVVPALLFLVTLGQVYLFAGYAAFCRKDL